MADSHPRTKRSLALLHLIDTMWLPEAHDPGWPFSRTAAGYGQVRLGTKPRLVHNVVCTAVHGPRPEGLFALHDPDCRNRACFYVPHLRWGTQSENEADKIVAGTSNDVIHRRAKLNADQVRYLRAQYAGGMVTMKELAEELGIDRETVSNVVHGRTYTDI